MKINKQLFEDVLAGKLKGTFVLRNGFICNGNQLVRNDNWHAERCPYRIRCRVYRSDGVFGLFTVGDSWDIIDFIPDIDVKENDLTIEIPNGKIVDWDESKKQNKIVLKDKQLTYEDICEKLFNEGIHYTTVRGEIVSNDVDSTNTVCITDSNNATTRHQLECILAKNKLANVAKYLNDGWKPIYGTSVWIIVWDCYLGYHAISIQAGSTAFKCYGLVIFKSKELAQQAIEILGEETIKLALEPLGV